MLLAMLCEMGALCIYESIDYVYDFTLMIE